MTDRLLSLLRKPATWVALCVTYAVLTALGKLSAVLGPAWVIGGLRCEEPTAVQRLRDGLPVYVTECAKLFGVSPSEIWVRFGESFFFALCWLVLSYFLLRHRPWARVAVLVLLAIGGLNYVALSIMATLHSGVPAFSLESLLFIAVLLFVFTRREVVALFRGGVEA